MTRYFLVVDADDELPDNEYRLEEVSTSAEIRLGQDWIDGEASIWGAMPSVWAYASFEDLAADHTEGVGAFRGSDDD